jgi:hypothetical protein
LGQVSAHPNEAMNSIKMLQQTAASLSVSQGILPSRPPLLSFGDYEAVWMSSLLDVF